MKIIKVFFRLSGLFLAAALTMPLTAGAVQVVADECTIDRQVERADYAFCGSCSKVEVETAGRSALGAGSTTYTFHVSDDIKGNIGAAAFTFRQAGTPSGSRWMVGFTCPPEGAKEYCVLLSCNDETKFCAPVCMSAGRYDVGAADDGRRVVKSGMSRRMLFNGLLSRRPSLSKSLPQREKEMISSTDELPMDRDDFLDLVKRLMPQDKGGAGRGTAK